MNRIFQAFLLTVSSVLLTACSTEGAEDYFLDEINASLLVTTSSSGRVSAQATFHPANKPLTFLMLSNRDSLTARIGSSVKEMNEESLLGVVTYTAKFNDIAPESLIEITLDRPSDVSAATSTVYLPEAVSNLSATSSSFSRSEPLTISWDLPYLEIDALSLSLSGSCIESFSQTLAANKTFYTLPEGILVAGMRTDLDVYGSCDIQVTVTTIRNGTLSPEYRSGYFKALTERSITLLSTP